jgi:UPF0716 protein FxsA
MRIAPIILMTLIAWPIGEIAMFIWVGGRIGFIYTIGLVLAAGFAGMALLRIKGLNLLRRLQGELSAGRMPTGELLEAFFILIAAVLLMLPGFLSDILAFFMLFAPVRRLLAALVSRYVTVSAGGTTANRRRSATSEDGVFDLDEGEYSRWEQPEGEAPRESPKGPSWTAAPAALPPADDDRRPDRP